VRGGATPIAVSARSRPARSTRPFDRLREGRWFPQRSPLVVLVASLLLTAAASAFVAWIGDQRDRQRYDNAVQAATDRIRTRLETYEAILYGARGLFAASDAVSRDDFATFVEQLAVGSRFPGVQGLGFSRWLNPPGADTGAAARAAALARGGSRAVRLWPETARAEYHAIAFLEPLDRRNEAALGFDMGTEAHRRAAMDRARDTGRPIASARVVLKQEIDVVRRQAGFLVYLPIYRGHRTPPTVDARRARLLGFVYAPFRVDDLLAGIFGSEEEPRVTFRIYDPLDARGVGVAGADRPLAPSDTAASQLLADARALTGVPRAQPALLTRDPAWTAVRRLDVFGRRWALVFTPARDVGGGARAALLLAGCGVVFSVALAQVTAAEVRARRRAEQADAIRGRFFAAMSHELRTPINAVIGYNDLLLAGVYGPVADVQTAAIERSQQAARHLLELVNDVLDLSKLEAGKIDVVVEPVPLSALLDDLLATIGPMAADRGAPVTVIGPACDAVLDTDPRRLRQILLNLLSNATRFGAGAPVTIRCRRLAPGDAPLGRIVGPRRALPAGALAIEVADHGPGVAHADQERIFEEFVQLPSAATGGTGLGLPISRRLAEALGGTLWVHSAAGAGATFSVVLPARPPHAVALVSAPP
jgi:signal transduction histidine kinase